MQAQDSGGNIINVASVSGLRPSPGTAAYGAAKAGLINLSQSLAIEWAPKIRVNAVALGMVETEQTEDHYGGVEGVARVAQSVPAGRMARPEDLAGLCLFLDSPAASYLSGACIPLHGGGETPAFLAASKGE
jgi:NAD(P)-dependent dehydrogenase (short-subunit alcohol dehydrogenase family)